MNEKVKHPGFGCRVEAMPPSARMVRVFEQLEVLLAFLAPPKVSEMALWHPPSAAVEAQPEVLDGLDATVEE